jgi:hypothetical protein
MTAFGFAERPVRRVALAAPAAIALVGLVLLATGHQRAAALAGAALVVTLGLLLEVDLPWGGQVPLGHAVLIAVAVLVEPYEAVAVAAVALAATAALRSRPRELAAVAGGAVAAAATRFAVGTAFGWSSVDARLLLDVGLVGTAYLAVDFAVWRRRFSLVAPVYVTLLCAAALLAVAFEQSPALSLVATVPLIVTKYSFGRLTQARQTYAQTTRALSLLPEVAGLTPLGHGERTAVYAAALADELGFDAAGADRVATAARLHHIGHISLHEPEERTGPLDTAELGRVSGELLRETGFLDDVADLVEQVQLGGDAVTTVEAAVIRVCSTLDDLAEDVHAGAAGDPFAALLARHPGGLERTTAIRLLALHDRRPELVDEARAASRILASVAAGGGSDPADLAGVGAHDHDGHDCR